MATEMKKNTKTTARTTKDELTENPVANKVNTEDAIAEIERKYSEKFQQMQELIAQLTAEKSEKIASVPQNYGIAKMDKPCTLIHLVECCPGLPTNIRVNNVDIPFSQFGERRTFRFSDMQDITARYRDWFERGVFTLGEDCDEFKYDFGLSIMNVPMSPEKYRMISALSDEEFKVIVDKINECQAILLAKTWIQRYENGEFGYDNLEKIRILNKKTKGFMKDFMSQLVSSDE